MVMLEGLADLPTFLYGLPLLEAVFSLLPSLNRDVQSLGPSNPITDLPVRCLAGLPTGLCQAHLSSLYMDQHLRHDNGQRAFLHPHQLR
jgi:hypothetical protein